MEQWRMNVCRGPSAVSALNLLGPALYKRASASPTWDADYITESIGSLSVSIGIWMQFIVSSTDLGITSDSDEWSRPGGDPYGSYKYGYYLRIIGCSHKREFYFHGTNPLRTDNLRVCRLTGQGNNGCIIDRVIISPSGSLTAFYYLSLYNFDDTLTTHFGLNFN